MTTARDPNPTTGSGVSIFLAHAADHLKTGECGDKAIVLRDYHDRKASQLLEAKSDLILAEVRIASWFVDLGFDGQCQVEDSSIGGVPCIMVDEDAEV